MPVRPLHRQEYRSPLAHSAQRAHGAQAARPEQAEAS
jgi:hypothetical protein